MKVYLMRHGDAALKSGEVERTLTSYGKEQILNVFNKVKDKELIFDRVFFSGLIRAKETANILLNNLKLENTLELAQELTPESDPSYWCDRLNKEDKNILLVGHQPYMSHLSYLLLKEDSVDFYTSTIACLSRIENNKWELSWFLKG
jgi:phosphohistidine phosphatase